MKTAIGLVIIALIVLAGCKQGSTITGNVAIDSTKKADGSTFQAKGEEVCAEDGKPVIRAFFTSWCPHCKWVKKTFINVIKDYEQRGKIKGYVWEVDKNDDLLTSEKEGAIPDSEIAVFSRFNSQQSIPTFVLGCKYVRVGNAFEAQNDLAAEEAEFRAAFDKLLNEAST